MQRTILCSTSHSLVLQNNRKLLGFLMKKEEKTLKSNVIYDGRILRLNCDDVLTSNGVKTKREVVHHNGGVCILAMVDGKIPMVKQFRYSYGEEMYELPAGKLEKGEDSYEAGIRELEEEVGLKAEKLVSLGCMYPSCGYTNEIIYLYKAENVTKTEMHLDPDEDLDVYYFTIEEISNMILKNEIRDAKTICLIFKYKESLK